MLMLMIMIKRKRCFWIAAHIVLITNPIWAGAQTNRIDPCAAALENRAVCDAANQHALEIMRADNLEAITVMQDVRTGSLIAFAASDPAKVDVTTALLPLSTVKLMLAASWWDHEQPDEPHLTGGRQMSVFEMIVSGNDQAGRQMASALRKSIGTEAVLKDLDRYGFAAQAVSSVSSIRLR
jgi:hypothetical protein